MTETLACWRDFLPDYFVLPHPSWLTIHWMRKNPWFDLFRVDRRKFHGGTWRYIKENGIAGHCRSPHVRRVLTPRAVKARFTAR